MAYDDRVWLAQYRDSTPPDIPLGGEGGFAVGLDMFAATVGRPRRQAAASTTSARTLTVGEVDRMSGALAAGAASPTASPPGDRLAVYLQNVPQFVIAVLAAWKAGGIVVPDQPDEQGARAHLRHRGLGRQGAGHVWSRCTTDVVSKSELPGRARSSRRASSTLPRTTRCPPCSSASMRNRSAETLDLLELVAAHDGEAPPPVAARRRTTSPS